MIAIVPSSSSVVAALRDLGFRNAGTPLLIASTPVSAAQPDENARAIRNTNANPRISPCSACISKSADSALQRVAEHEDLEEPPPQHDEHADDERVGGDRERGARFADTAQVHRRPAARSPRPRTTPCAGRRTAPPNRCWTSPTRSTPRRSARSPPAARWPRSARPSARDSWWPPRSRRRRTGRRARSAGSWRPRPP